MPKPTPFSDVELRTLPPIQVVHRLLRFTSVSGNPDNFIRPAFSELRQKVSDYGFDPDTLLHVGVPEVIDGELVTYDCCIEFPLPETESIRLLPGGRYAVLTVEKVQATIGPAIRAFAGDFLPEHGWIKDDEMPVYEIYFKDTLEYCVPIH